MQMNENDKRLKKKLYIIAAVAFAVLYSLNSFIIEPFYISALYNIEYDGSVLLDGWTYGSVRDDAKKHHPCLVPYNQLPDSEKEYDRNTAISTLKFIVKKGYAIRKVDSDTKLVSCLKVG